MRSKRDRFTGHTRQFLKLRDTKFVDKTFIWGAIDGPWHFLSNKSGATKVGASLLKIPLSCVCLISPQIFIHFQGEIH